MKRVYWIFVVAVTVCALSLNTFAQPGGGRGQGPGGGMGPGMGMPGGMGPGGIGGILQNPEFARHLELTPEQTTELQRVTREAAEAMRNQFQNMPRPEPGAVPPNPDAMREMRQRMEAGMGEVQASIDRVLRPEQRTKLRETTFQLSGGLNSPIMGTPMGNAALDALNLTDAQREQFRKLAEERPRMNPGDYDLRDPEGQRRFRADMEAANARFAEQVRGILTAEQRAKAERLTAEAPTLRERLGIPAPGQPQQQRGQQQRQTVPGSGFVPGSGAWQPGSTPSDAPGGGQRQSRFPRGEN